MVVPPFLIWWYSSLPHCAFAALLCDATIMSLFSLSILSDFFALSFFSDLICVLACSRLCFSAFSLLCTAISLFLVLCSINENTTIHNNIIISMPIDADVMVSSKSFIESEEFMFDCNSLMLYFFFLA